MLRRLTLCGPMLRVVRVGLAFCVGGVGLVFCVGDLCNVWPDAVAATRGELPSRLTKKTLRAFLAVSFQPITPRRLSSTAPKGACAPTRRGRYATFWSAPSPLRRLKRHQATDIPTIATIHLAPASLPALCEQIHPSAFIPDCIRLPTCTNTPSGVQPCSNPVTEMHQYPLRRAAGQNAPAIHRRADCGL